MENKTPAYSSDLASNNEISDADKNLKLAEVAHSSTHLVHFINEVSARYLQLTYNGSSKNKAKTIAHLAYLHPFLQQTALNAMHTSGESLTLQMAEEYGTRCLRLTAILCGLVEILNLADPSWDVIKLSVVKIGQILLGKSGKKYPTNHINDDSDYRFFEKCHRYTTETRPN